MAFKMKGSPMKRNFPGSFKQVEFDQSNMDRFLEGPTAEKAFREKLNEWRENNPGKEIPEDFYLKLKADYYPFKPGDIYASTNMEMRNLKSDAERADAKVKYIQHITGLHENPEGEELEQSRLDYLARKYDKKD